MTSTTVLMTSKIKFFFSVTSQYSSNLTQ